MASPSSCASWLDVIPSTRRSSSARKVCLDVLEGLPGLVGLLGLGGSLGPPSGTGRPAGEGGGGQAEAFKKGLDEAMAEAEDELGKAS